MTTPPNAKVPPRGARWLALAAAPTFALMALASAAHPAPAICAMAGGPSGGMTAMYGLMALFHLSPWLTLTQPRPRERALNGERP